MHSWQLFLLRNQKTTHFKKKLGKVKAMKKYFLGRFNLSANYSNYSEKEDFIDKTLRANAFVEEKGYKYIFSGVEKFSYENNYYFTAFLLKYRSSEEHEVVNERGEPEKVSVSDEIIGRGRFILDSKTGLIAYTVQGSRITRKSFENRFSSIFDKVHNGFFVEARIDSIEDRGNFAERIAKMLKIQSIRIVLHPSNPNSDKIWKELDDRLKAEMVAKYTEQYDAKKDGPSIQVDKTIEERIAMSEDGYGVTAATGKNQNNENVVYKTSDNPQNVQGPDHDIPVQTVMQLVFPAMKRIIDRIRKQ
ncbi:hypothetical protein A0257_10195 [Hymenobacter psoromatis]|nr:hypothetical protein A0257_10195 [Hymenobacter psoromatis]